MKPTFSKFFVLVLLITFISISTASPVSTQAPEPPEILENGEFPQTLNYVEQAITERRQTAVNSGDNSINAATSWFSFSGTGFVPGTNTNIYTYGAAGCVDTSADFQFWRGSVNIPHGSTITGMFFDYYNEVFDPAESYIWLTGVKYDGSLVEILSVTGTYNAAGYQTESTYDVANNVVNNYDYTYVLSWLGKTQQELCGINLGYTPPPLFLSALPIITR